MTLATLVHGLVAMLATLLVVEARTHARRQLDPPRRDTSDAATTTFEAWRIVRWDDENHRPITVNCQRDAVANQLTLRDASRGRHGTRISA